MATVDTFEILSGDGESREFYWLTKEDIEYKEHIKTHIKSMALKALKVIACIK